MDENLPLTDRENQYLPQYSGARTERSGCSPEKPPTLVRGVVTKLKLTPVEIACILAQELSDCLILAIERTTQ